MLNIFKKNNCELISNFKNINFSKNIEFEKEFLYNIDSLNNEVLDIQKNKKTPLFKIFYSIHKNYDKLLFKSTNISSDLFVLYPKFLGREYAKTPSISLSNKGFNFNEILFEVLNGEGYFILENLDDIQEIKVIKVKKGSKILIPKNFVFEMINTSKDENLIAINLKQKNLEYKFNTLNKNYGFTIYLTKTGFIRNQNLSPMYHIEDYIGDYLEDYSFEKEDTIYKQFTKLSEKFNFLKS